MLVQRKNYGFPTFESMVNEFFNGRMLGGFENSVVNEKINIKENDTSYDVSLALPGFSKKDVNIELNDGILTVSSKIEKTDENKDVNYIHKSFSTSSFSQSFTISDDVDVNNINAEMENGILNITLGKLNKIEEVKVKLIEIK